MRASMRCSALVGCSGIQVSAHDGPTAGCRGDIPPYGRDGGPVKLGGWIGQGDQPSQVAVLDRTEYLAHDLDVLLCSHCSSLDVWTSEHSAGQQPDWTEGPPAPGARGADDTTASTSRHLPISPSGKRAHSIGYLRPFLSSRTPVPASPSTATLPNMRIPAMSPSRSREPGPTTRSPAARGSAVTRRIQLTESGRSNRRSAPTIVWFNTVSPATASTKLTVCSATSAAPPLASEEVRGASARASDKPASTTTGGCTSPLKATPACSERSRPHPEVARALSNTRYMRRRFSSRGISRSPSSTEHRSVTIQSPCQCLPVPADGRAERVTLESSELRPPAGTCRQPPASFRNSFRLADRKSVSRRGLRNGSASAHRNVYKLRP